MTSLPYWIGTDASGVTIRPNDFTDEDAEALQRFAGDVLAATDDDQRQGGFDELDDACKRTLTPEQADLMASLLQKCARLVREASS